MGINVNNLTPQQAKELWRDYNNGNKNDLSRAEYASLCTKFNSYVTKWEQQDENGYTYRASGDERLDFDEDDAGFFGSDGKGVESTLKTGANVAIATGKPAVWASNSKWENVAAEEFRGMADDFHKNPEGLTDADIQQADMSASNAETELAKKEAGSLLVMAAMQLAMAIHTRKNSPNADAVEACKTAQNELYTEQAVLAEQVATMEEMQEEMAVLQEEAEARNEEGQASIGTMEGQYNYYYTKYQSGKATSQDIALMNALAAQMQVEQAASTEETGALNEEIAAVGENYEVVSDNIATTNEFTDYVSEIDEATKTNSIIQGALMTASCVSAGVTAAKCIARASSLGWLGGVAAIMYTAAAAAAGTAAGLYGAEALKQFTTNRKTADDTIEIREQTQELSQETTEFQEVSTEFWEESVDATSTENLFTMTATYADQTALTTGAKGGTRTSDVTGGSQTGNSRSTGTGQTEGTNQASVTQGVPTTPQTGQEDEEKKKIV